MGGSACLRWLGMRAAGCARQASIRPTLIAPSFLFVLRYWSAFSQNRYLEEVEKCSTPGSVAKKAAYFDAYYKKIAVQRALLQQSLTEEENRRNGTMPSRNFTVLSLHFGYRTQSRSLHANYSNDSSPCRKQWVFVHRSFQKGGFTDTNLSYGLELQNN